MKVVHLSAVDYGGAGIAAYRLHKGLQSVGIESQMLVLSKTIDDDSIKILPDFIPTKITSVLEKKEHFSPYLKMKWGLWANINQIYPERPKGLDAFSETTSEVDISKIQEVIEADIINLHWVAGILNYDIDVDKLRGKKIVWTLHDMNPFTGGCHYAGDCLKFETGCFACPQLGSNNSNDLSAFNWKKKQQFYTNFDFQIVTPSKWLGKCTANSRLLGNYDIEIIPYSFPIDKFCPYEKLQIKEAYNIPLNKKLILFGAAYETERKGLKYLLEALNNLEIEKCSDYVIGIFGLPPKQIFQKQKFDIIQFGQIKDIGTLAKVYSAADVFVIPALEDNLPNTVIEAMSCGTPVVGFNTGGIPDMISHKKNGYIAQYKDPDDLLKGMLWILENPNHKVICDYCRQTALEKYELKIQAERYSILYKNLLGNKCNTKTEQIDDINLLIEKAIEKNNFSEALELLKVCIDKNPADIKALNNLAIVQILLRDVNSATRTLNLVLQIDPDNSIAKENLTSIHKSD